jgi:hypothetical protein
MVSDQELFCSQCGQVHSASFWFYRDSTDGRSASAYVCSNQIHKVKDTAQWHVLPPGKIPLNPA